LNGLASNLRIRLAAVLTLLALHPCARFLAAQFVSSQSGDRARIEFIDDDMAILNVAFSRRNSPPLARAAGWTPALASISGDAGARSCFWAYVSEPRFSAFDYPVGFVLGARAPPLFL
jgi:hypothetical protein